MKSQSSMSSFVPVANSSTGPRPFVNSGNMPSPFGNAGNCPNPFVNTVTVLTQDNQ